MGGKSFHLGTVFSTIMCLLSTALLASTMSYRLMINRRLSCVFYVVLIYNVVFILLYFPHPLSSLKAYR